MDNKKPDYIEIVNTRSKTLNEKTIKYKGKYIHSLYHPLQEAEDMIASYHPYDQYKVIIILGLGLGYILEALLKKINPLKTKIYIIEQESYFQKFIQQKNYPEQVKFFFHVDKEIVVKYILKELVHCDYRHVLFLENKFLVELDLEYYSPIKEKIKIFFQQELADVTTTAYYSEQWITHCFINLKKIRNFIFLQDLHKDYEHQTGLLVASGPSVEQDIDFIKSFQGPIFVLPPSVHYLMKNNVGFDFIILGDSNYVNMYHLKNVMDADLNLMVDLSCHPSIVEHWKGKMIIFNYQIPGFEFFYEKFKIPYIPQGGTVSSSSLYIMKYLGIQNIILSGQDFAYHDYQLHVKGSGYEKYYVNRVNKWESLLKYNFVLIRNNEPKYIDAVRIQDHKLKLYQDWFNQTLNFLQLSILKKENGGPVKKKEQIGKTNERIDVKNELEFLLNKLNKISFQENIREIHKKLRDEKQILNLLESFNYSLFLKLKKNFEVDTKEFNCSLQKSIEKIKFLINYNLHDNTISY